MRCLVPLACVLAVCGLGCDIADIFPSPCDGYYCPDDGNPCTGNYCRSDLSSARCVAVDKLNGTPCGSGNVCFDGQCLENLCAEVADACGSVPVDPIEPTCTLAAPPEEDGCDGTESVENPATCTAADNLITIRVTQLQIDWDCDSGYDLDSCTGYSCAVGSLALGEGIDGVDNAIAGLGPVAAGLGENLSRIDQALHDGLCAGAIAIGFTIDANLDENCANVDVLNAAGEVDRSIVMNFSDTACLSGATGSIPIDVGGVEGALANTLLRATVSNGGLSNGTIGGTIDQVTVAAIADLLVDGGSALAGQVLDINQDLSGDTANGCNAVSTTMTIGGVEVVPTPTGNCDYGDCTDGSAQQLACDAAVIVCEATLAGDPLAVCIEASNTDACGPRP
jgi:hypothetical protein